MAKKKLASRISISVPAELKRRMESVTKNTNWSAVACEAFAAKLAELTPTKEVKTMQGVVERFRRLRQEEEGSDYHDGASDGRKWAMNAATPEHLENLEELRVSLPGDDWSKWFNQKEAQKKLTTAIDPTITFPERFLDFWHEIRHWKGQTSDYFRGFAEGALDVWDEVKDQI